MITQTSESLNEDDVLLQGKGGLRANGTVDSVEEKRSELLSLRKEVTDYLDSYAGAGRGFGVPSQPWVLKEARRPKRIGNY